MIRRTPLSLTLGRLFRAQFFHPVLDIHPSIRRPRKGKFFASNLDREINRARAQAMLAAGQTPVWLDETIP